MARNIWIISDLHLGHDNIIKYCNRPFENTYYMNQCIRDNWNSVVKPQDIVWNLGDVYMGKSWTSGETIYDFLRSLNGHKRLILGNHDNGLDQNLIRTHEKIVVWRMFTEFRIMLTHIPIHKDSFRHKCKINVHGHLHNNVVMDANGRPDKMYKNVCVEHTNYFPVHIDTLRVL